MFPGHDRPQNPFQSNNKQSCLPRSSDLLEKRAEAFGRSHYPQTGTVGLRTNTWARRKPDNHIDTLTHHKPHWHRHRCPGWRMSVIVSPTAQQQTKLTGNENGSITLKISASALCNYALRGAGLHLPTHKHAASWDINWKYCGAQFTGEVRMIHAHLSRRCLHKFYSSTMCVF